MACLPRNRRDRIIEHVYAQLPDVGCKGLCQDCCGSVAMSPTEQERIRERHGHTLPLAAVFPPPGCTALTAAGACSVYTDRPFICRLWGATELLRCPHGCIPTGGFLPEDHAQRLTTLIQTT